MSKTLILADDVNHHGPVTDVFESAEGSRLWTIVDPGEASEFTKDGITKDGITEEEAQ